MRKTRLAWGLIAAFALLQIGVLTSGLWALAHAPVLDFGGRPTPVKGEPGESACHWLVGPPLGAPDGSSCLLSVAGLELEAHTLVDDPGYLSTRAARAGWYEDHGYLRERLATAAAATVQLEDADGTRRTAVVPVERSWRHAAGQGPATLVLVAAAIMALAGLVLVRRPRQRAARALFLFCAGVALLFLAVIPSVVPGALVPGAASRLQLWVNLYALAMLVTALVQLSLQFPGPQVRPRTERWIVRVTGGLVFAVMTLDCVGLLPQAGSFAGMLGAGAAVVLMIRSMRRSRGPVQRLQVRWVLWGVATPIGMGLVIRMPLLLFPDLPANPSDMIVYVSALTVPLGLGIAVLRHRLLDIDVVIRRTIVGALATLAVLFLYNLAVAVFASGLTAEEVSAPRVDAVLVVAFLLTFVLVPVQTRLDAMLDRLVYPERQRQRDVLGRLPDELATVTTTDGAARRVLERIGASLEASPLVVALAPPGFDPEETSAATPATAAARTRLWRRVTAALHAGDARPDEARIEPPEDEAFWAVVDGLDDVRLGAAELGGDALDAWMAEVSLAFALPLRTPTALVGVLAGALQPAERLISAEDVGLLRTVGAALALALSRSQAYETIRRMNEELEQRVQSRTAELEGARLQLYQWEKMASLGVLAAGVAHELNTPLGVVVSTADQLQRRLEDPGLPDARTTRLSKLCAEGSRRAADIIDNLRRFSRPESQNLQPVDLGEIVDATLDLLRPTLARRGVAVTAERGDLPPIEGFPVLLNQILTNLINNAAAALGDGGEVRVSTEGRGDDRVALIVEDDGPGIDVEVRPHIFDPFFTTKAPGEGTGLGLSLCYSFVEQHGGRIWEEGAEGQGARFVVELPLRHPGADGSGLGTLSSIRPVEV